LLGGLDLLGHGLEGHLFLDADTALSFSWGLCGRRGRDDWLDNLCLFRLCLLWLRLLWLSRLLGPLLLQLLALLSLLLLLSRGQLLWLLWLLYGFNNWLSSCWLGSLLLWGWGLFGLLWGGLGLGLSCFLWGFNLGNGPFSLICLRCLCLLLGGLLATASPCLGIFLLCLVEPRVRVLCILVPEIEN